MFPVSCTARFYLYFWVSVWTFSCLWKRAWSLNFSEGSCYQVDPPISVPGPATRSYLETVWRNALKRWNVSKGSSSGCGPGELRWDSHYSCLTPGDMKSLCIDFTSGCFKGQWLLPFPLGFQLPHGPSHQVLLPYCKKQNMLLPPAQKSTPLSPLSYCRGLLRCSECVCLTVTHVFNSHIFYWKGCESVSLEFKTERLGL